MASLASRLHRTWGMGRSLVVYHGIPGRQRRLRRLYRCFVKPGQLAFDLGAHVGNRTRALRALGCRVVAVEPQPDCARLLRSCFDDSDRRKRGRRVHTHPAIGHVAVLEMAVGASSGPVSLAISERHPTLTTTSAAWLETRGADPLFARIRWNRHTTVEATTLDLLIQRFGLPSFVKIDVEGSESEVLAGLTQPVPGLSFEFLPSALADVRLCVKRLEALGRYGYNWSSGESYKLASADWLTGKELMDALESADAQRRSGDVYAVLGDR
ncbi:MAG: FkbM family methyltransferase [Acidobacteria bacterium]|nr:FkbM family methyltransferase [Acidobacteriota bacterium]MXZ72873.1 FkbM family methyltransferase [Acidobacteriota bacterium]MYJ05378.1 FkbM family methyltransferase [Acidobacteriota bacterium]